MNPNDFAKVKLGMTTKQISFLIGDPVMGQPFNSNRWDYVYLARIKYREPVIRHISLFFKNGKLDKIDGDMDELMKQLEAQKKPSDTAPKEKT